MRQNMGGRKYIIPSQVLCFDATGTPLAEAQVYDVVTIVEVFEHGQLVPKYALRHINNMVFDLSRFLPLWQH